MIKRLVAFDLDATLFPTALPEEGKIAWANYYNRPFPYIGWWGRKESLDLNIFDIKPFPSMYQQYLKEKNTPDTYVIVLTSRMEKLRPEVQAILDINNIHVDKLDMKHSELTKGEKILQYVAKFPDLVEISVFDDRDTDIESYQGIKHLLPQHITFNIYEAHDGNFALVESEFNVGGIIDEVIKDFVAGNYIYHGTSDGAGYHIQREGRMRPDAANEQFTSFTSDLNVANYYANMKGGDNKAVVLRTKLTDDFQQSPKFNKKDGYEWITTKEIPVSELEINTKYGWIPLSNWDFIDKEIKK